MKTFLLFADTTALIDLHIYAVPCVCAFCLSDTRVDWLHLARRHVSCVGEIYYNSFALQSFVTIALYHYILWCVSLKQLLNQYSLCCHPIRRIQSKMRDVPLLLLARSTARTRTALQGGFWWQIRSSCAFIPSSIKCMLACFPQHA